MSTLVRTLEKISYPKNVVKIFPLAVQKKLPKEVSVIKVSSKKSRELNCTYLGKDSVANILSFLYGPEYGEIMVCPAVIRAEAKAQGNSFQYQMTWMIVHGMLHLAGVHHEASTQAERRFEELERRVLQEATAKMPL